MILAASFAGIMALIGWCIIATICIVVVSMRQDYISAWGNAFGWPSPKVNWTVRCHVIAFIWIISFLLYFLL